MRPGVKGAPALVVWLGGDRPDDARLAWAVEVSAPAPRAELTVHVDALSGAVLAVDDALRSRSGRGAGRTGAVESARSRNEPARGRPTSPASAQ